MNVWWCGPANDAGGYGKMNRECVEGLFKKGVGVQLDLFKIPDIRSSVSITPSLSKMINYDAPEKAPCVWAIMPPKFLFRPEKETGRKILFTMMESKDIHQSFINKVNMADELWVPCKFNLDSFKEAKVSPDIYHMPLGVDTDLYRPMELTEEQRNIFNVKLRSFTFMSLFGWSLRKGYDCLLKAYLKCFTAKDDVSLMIVSRKNGSADFQNIKEIQEEIKRYIIQYCPDPSNAPHIVHIGQSMPEEQLPILYNMCDCFVLSSRGEGFGLPFLEAGACEKPVIGTNCSGQTDFLNEEVSYLVECEGYGVNKDIMELSSYYQGVPFAILGQKAVDELAEKMDHVVKNYSEAREKGKLFRKNIKDNFTWDKLVDRIYNRLKDCQ